MKGYFLSRSLTRHQQPLLSPNPKKSVLLCTHISTLGCSFACCESFWLPQNCICFWYLIMFIITALRSCIYNVAKHQFLPSIRDERLFNYMNINVEQLNSWIWMLLMLICFCSYFALESRIRLFTASEVDCIFWPVIKCLSITTCTASSWLAEKRRHTHERIFVIFFNAK